MTLNDFRIAHSDLIENYQYIEMHLEGIYAQLSGERFDKGLKDVEQTNLHRLLGKVRESAEGRNETILSDEETARLCELIKRRNYWVHECCTKMLRDRKTGAPKKEEDVAQMRTDIKEAEELRQLLYDKYMMLNVHRNYRQDNITKGI